MDAEAVSQSVASAAPHMHTNCTAVSAAPQRHDVETWEKSTDALRGELGRFAIIIQTALVYYYS